MIEKKQGILVLVLVVILAGTLFDTAPRINEYGFETESWLAKLTPFKWKVKKTKKPVVTVPAPTSPTPPPVPASGLTPSSEPIDIKVNQILYMGHRFGGNPDGAYFDKSATPIKAGELAGVFMADAEGSTPSLSDIGAYSIDWFADGKPIGRAHICRAFKDDKLSDCYNILPWNNNSLKRSAMMWKADVPAGNHVITAVFDPNNIIPETNENNNTVSINVRVEGVLITTTQEPAVPGGPPVVVVNEPDDMSTGNIGVQCPALLERADLRASRPDCKNLPAGGRLPESGWSVGTEIRFYVRLESSSKFVKIKDHLVRWFVDGKPAQNSNSCTHGGCNDRASADNFPPNKNDLTCGGFNKSDKLNDCTDFLFVWTAEAGKHTITATIDPDNVIKETDETNNTKSLSINVPVADPSAPAPSLGSNQLGPQTASSKPGLWYVKGNSDYQGFSFGLSSSIPVPIKNFSGRKAYPGIFDNGNWYIPGQPTVAWGNNSDIPVPADYNGDGKPEIAVFRPAGQHASNPKPGVYGEWQILGQASPRIFGSGVFPYNDIPVPGDYNGDGKAEIAVYRATEGRWYIDGQSSAIGWGQDGDVPVPADYNGDGKTDIAIVRKEAGAWQWWVYDNPEYQGLAYGSSDSKLIPADYNGDGKTDIAVAYATGGAWHWYVRNDSNYQGMPYGASDSIPVPADYNGDGKADIAVWWKQI